MQIDFYTAFAVAANIALALLGAIVSVYEKWTKKHRSAIVVSFVALGALALLPLVHQPQSRLVIFRTRTRESTKLSSTLGQKFWRP
jgi:hypothetical protein